MNIEELKELNIDKLYQDAVCFKKVTNGDAPAVIGKIIADGNYILFFIEDGDTGGFYLSFNRESFNKHITSGSDE